MKVTVIGGGSTYTPELVSGFLKRVETPAQPYRGFGFPVSELCLMDIDAERLRIVGGFAQRMVTAHGSPFRVTLTSDQRQAVQGAAYVVTQLRVGMMPARREDEYLGQRHGLIGQETTGVGGMAKALRTIPVILGIAEDMRRLAPGAMLVNFTNPAGLVTEALSRHAPDIPSVGVCNVGITAKMQLLNEAEKLLGKTIAPERALLQTLGLNHLTWHSGFTVDGEELWPHIFTSYLDKLRSDPDPEWKVETLESLGMIPNYYLQYFYYTQKKLGAQKRWPPIPRGRSDGDRGGPAAAVRRPILERTPGRADETRRGLLLHPGDRAAQFALQRPGTGARGQRAQPGSGARLAG